MAAFTWTFATLETAIKAWTEDDSDEFDAVIDDIMGLAEQRIYRDVDLDVFRKHATATMTSGDEYFAKPSDFVLDRWMYITVSGKIVWLEHKEVSFCRDYWHTPASTSVPKYYADWDDNTILIAPTPDSAYVATMSYRYRPARMDSNTTTTWLGTNAPDLMLWACMVEAGTFLQSLGTGQEPGMLQVWEAKYQGALQMVKDEEIRRQRTTESRTGEDKI